MCESTLEFMVAHMFKTELCRKLTDSSAKQLDHHNTESSQSDMEFQVVSKAK
jgi:hypothetical protein